MKEATAVGISLSDFNLPVELKPLLKKTKKPQIEQNPDYQNLLSKLKELQAPGIIALDTFLQMFLNQGFKTA